MSPHTSIRIISRIQYEYAGGGEIKWVIDGIPCATCPQCAVHAMRTVGLGKRGGGEDIICHLRGQS